MPEFLSSYLSLRYWFAQYSEPFQGTAFWVALGIAAGLVVLGIILRPIAGLVGDASYRKALKRLSVMSATVGVLTAISFFFTQTSTPVLGSRFWFLIWGLIAAAWLFFIVRYLVAVAPGERSARAQLQTYQKYLPKSGR